MAKEENKQIEPEELESTESSLPEADFGEILASWEFSEHIHQRGKLWYLIFTLVIVGLLIYAYFNNNPLFAVIIIISLLVYIISEKRGSKIINFTIAEDGVIIDNKFISYDDFDHFYIIYYPPEIKNLYLQPKNNLKPLLTISLEDQNPIEIRQALLEFIPEDLSKEERPTTESLTDWLKF